MYFVALLFKLRLRDNSAPLTVADSLSISDAFLSYLRCEDAPVPQEHITVALLHSDRQRATVRLTFCGHSGTTAAATLMNALASQSQLPLGQSRYDVECIDLADSAWTGVSTWADLMSEKIGCFIRFSFAIPVMLAQPERDRNQGVSSFPEPFPLFSGLVSQWQALGGPALPHDVKHVLQASGCVVSNYRLHTVKIGISGRLLVGCLGWIEYECRKREAIYVASLNALARLAFFTGVGHLVAQGMGATMATISN